MKIFFVFVFLVSRVSSENFTENGENLRRFPRSVSCGVAANGIGYVVRGEKIQKGDFPW
jgi:hypothetical protein